VRSTNKDLQPELSGGGGDDRIFFAGGALDNVLGLPSPALSGGSGNDRLVKRSVCMWTLASALNQAVPSPAVTLGPAENLVERS
jgi:hypothetical protein